MPSAAHRLTGGYRRTTLAAAASVGLLLAGFGPAARAPAQETAPAPFSNGTAKATAVVAKVAPGIGSLELALASGVAVAEMKNDLVQAQAQALDLGLIGSALTAEGCGDAILTADQLPQPTRADNRGGDTALQAYEIPLVPGLLGGGEEKVEARKGQAQAIATAVSGANQLVAVDVGKATATTRVVDGNAREARASVETTIDIAGVLQLSALRWDALHRTGAHPEAKASFDLGTAQLLGLPVPLDSLVVLESVINAALADVGISISFPKVERFTEPNDLIRITPLRITLKDTPLGKSLLGPLLGATRTQRIDLNEQIAQAVCQAAGALLVGDVGVSIASGTGFLTIEIGGAEAFSGELLVEDPFGPPVPPDGAAEAPPTLASPALPPTFTPTLPVATPPAVTERPAAPERTASIGPLEKVCESIHPNGSGGCSEGSLASLGLLGLGATAGVGFLDWRHQRRRKGSAGAAAL